MVGISRVRTGPLVFGLSVVLALGCGESDGPNNDPGPDDIRGDGGSGGTSGSGGADGGGTGGDGGTGGMVGTGGSVGTGGTGGSGGSGAVGGNGGDGGSAGSGGSGAVGGKGGSAGDGGSGGDPLCAGVDCPSANECVNDGTCDPSDGSCIVGDNKPMDTACSEGGGVVCDDSGNCVGCNRDNQCAPCESCVFNFCRENRVGFLDETFHNIDWTIRTLKWHAGGSASGAQVTEGGNPGEYRSIVTTKPANDAAVVAVNLHDRAVYDPSVEGAILSIDYSEDAAALSPSGQWAGAALFQAGKFYVRLPGVSTSSWSGWQTVEDGLLTESDFQQVVDDDGFHPEVNPDFSSSGSEIQFGFYRYISGSCRNTSSGRICSSASTREGGIDNWRVLIRHSPVACE